jgi:hypothetical protein
MMLAFFTWRAIRSFWSQQYDLSQKYKLKKGATEFHDPIRPHSKNFYAYLQLALMITPNRQERLTKIISKRLKEFLELYPYYSPQKMSEELELLINEPNKWLKNQYEKHAISRFSRKKVTADFLHDQIIKLLTEIEDIYDLQNLPN